MIIVDDTTADISVTGDTAPVIANSFLSSLDGEIEDLAAVEVAVTLNGGRETHIDLAVSGDDVAHIVGQLVAGMDWDTLGIEEIQVSLSEADPTEVEEGLGEGTAPKTSHPHVRPWKEPADKGTIQYPARVPERIRQGTNHLRVAELMLEYVDVVGEDWMSSNELTDFAGDQMEKNEITSTLSDLFHDKGLIVREPMAETPGVGFDYHPTAQLAEEVERLNDD